MNREATPKIAFERTCRGKGKIYIALSVPSGIEVGRIWAESLTKAGKRVPARVLHRGGDAYLLIVPILSVTQQCKVFVADDKGEVVVEAQRTIVPRVAQLKSAANSLRHDAMASEIRDYDELAGNDGLIVYMDRIVNSVGPGCFVQGSIILQGQLCERLEGSLRFEFLDSAGENALDRELLIMRDSTASHPYYPNMPMRTIQFSAHLREGVDSLIVRPLDMEDAENAPFISLEQSWFVFLRNLWQECMQPGFDDGLYDTWYRNEHAPTATELQYQALRKFDIEPTFSIVVPLYHTPAHLFDLMVASVLKQSYGKFELVLVNSTPEDIELADHIKAWKESDDRIVVVELPENLGITENTNAGIKVATGDFLCFLDHDDELTLDALYRYTKAVNEYPETDLLYSDEDKIDGDRFRNPYFKPDWDPELMTGMNYVCHFLCVRKSIVDELEPAGGEYDGAQDYHMTLRVSERARNIHHVRRVLYHWRVTPESTASGVEVKPYAVEAGRKAVQSHIDRCGLDGKAVDHPTMPTKYEVIYGTPGNPLVSILIPNKDNAEILDRCLRSILERSTYSNYEIVIIENNSVDQDTFAYYEKAKALDDRIRVEYFEGGFNFSRINNFGVQKAKGDYLLMLNNDTEVISEDWLERMLGICMLEGVGAVGVKLHYPDWSVQHAGVLSMAGGPCHANQYLDGDEGGYFGTATLRHDLNAVTAACLMTTREAFERVGGMDEQFAVDYNDVDFCYALRDAGYRIVFEAGVHLYHYESASRGFHTTDDSKLLFVVEAGLLRQKWPKQYLFADTYNNPNLDQDNAYYHGSGKEI